MTETKNALEEPEFLLLDTREKPEEEVAVMTEDTCNLDDQECTSCGSQSKACGMCNNSMG